MKGIKNFMKTHKALLIVIGVIIALLIAGILVYLKLSPDSKKDLYGNHLDGIEEHPIDEVSVTNMQSEMSTMEGITSISYNLKGRLINIIIKFDPNLPKDNAIWYANKSLEYFSEDAKSYYDIQVFLLTDGESDIYPMIGYKHKTSSGLVWKQE